VRLGISAKFFSKVREKMVILRDLSEVDEGNFSQISYIGTPLERQIRAHFTRADDLLNRSGYFFLGLGCLCRF
jgi:hypothetical protein